MYGASVVDVIPRIEGDIGWLLYALCGDVSTVSNLPENNLYTHVFLMDSTDYLALNWLTERRVFPAPSGGAASGIQVLDSRIASMMFTFAAASTLSARITTVGRQPTYSDDVSGWTWSDTAEGLTSVVTSVSSSGYWKMPDFQAGALPTQLVRVTVGNQVTTPQQEFIIGSPYPDDLVPLYRSMGIEVNYKWEDEDLYLQLETAGGTGASIAWSPTIYTSDFIVREESDANISGFSNPYSMEIRAEKVYWWPTQPPEVAGVNVLQLPMRGLVARPDSGNPFEIRIVNEVAGYIWP